MAHPIPTPQLREPREEDWPQILRLANESVRAVAGAGTQEEWLRNRRRPAAWRRHFVAVEEGAVIGYAAIESRFGEIEQGFRLFVVASPERLPQVGLVLCRRLEELLVELHAAEAWFLEYAADRSLLAFLAGQGFQSTRSFLLESGVECVVLSKRLPLGLLPME